MGLFSGRRLYMFCMFLIDPGQIHSGHRNL